MRRDVEPPQRNGQAVLCSRGGSRGALSGREDGGATLVVVSCCAVLCLLATALAVAGAMVVAHRKAQAAADLTALAAARDGCGRAAEVAAANEAVVLACSLEGSDALVTVQVAGPRAFGWGEDFDARARAGPGSAP